MQSLINNQIWLTPLKEAEVAGTPILSRDDIRSIFSDITVIHSFNSQLLKEIETRVSGWHSGACIGDIFLRIVCMSPFYVPLNFMPNLLSSHITDGFSQGRKCCIAFSLFMPITTTSQSRFIPHSFKISTTL
jgi:hypothetical protein